MIPQTKLELRDGVPSTECRSFNSKLELREFKKEGFVGQLIGYAIVYGVESRDMGGWKELITRGAFSESLKNADVRLLYQHDKSKVMARQSAGNLRLSEDEHGVRFEADLIDTTLNRDALLEIRSGNLDAMSFGAPKATFKSKFEVRNGNKLRLVTSAEVAEISVVSWAAYEDTALAARELAEFVANGEKNLEEEQRFNHNHGKGGQFAAGSEVHTSHTPNVKKGTSVGEDPDQKTHHIVKLGNSIVSIPKSQVHASKADAEKALGIERSAPVGVDPLLVRARMRHSSLELRYNHKHGKGGKFASADEMSDKASRKTDQASERSREMHDPKDKAKNSLRASAHHQAADAHRDARSAHMQEGNYGKARHHEVMEAKHTTLAVKAETAHLPFSHVHGGVEHYSTGKVGHDRVTGEASQEMASTDDSSRIWMSKSGKVKQD